jgi:pantoate--beta-alanine ligase
LITWIQAQKASGSIIGFVPTMGALHQGHVSLVTQCADLADKTVVSIFVNPLQFNNPEDYKKYPRNHDADIALLQKSRCDVLFLPEYQDIYPENLQSSEVDLGILDQVLEGHHRPGHFQGVAKVVERLFNIVTPELALFGMKDYQQLLVISHMTTVLNLPVKIIPCPVIRDRHGLALSSRNQRLTDNGRISARQIFQALKFCESGLTQKTKFNVLRAQAIEQLSKSGIETEYLALYDATKFVEAQEASKGSYIVLFAGYLEGVRLIDNLMFSV